MANRTFDYGDLRVSMVSSYGWVWDDTGSGAHKTVCLWTPTSQGDLSPLGDYAQAGGFRNRNINGTRASLLVGQNPNTSPAKPAVARPIGYTQIWGDWGSGGDYDVIIWRPVAPEGYVALGDVGCYGYNNKPSLTKIWCVREDLVGYGKFLETDTWNDRGSGLGSETSLWEIQPGSIGVDGAEYIPALADTFIIQTTYSRPSGDAARVLLLPVPKDYDKFEAPVPTIEAKRLPSRGDQFTTKEQCKVTLPFHFFFQPTHQESLDHISNPFLTLSRTISWYTEGVWANNTGGTFSREQRLLCGVSKEKREEMTHSVGVEVTGTYGIELASVSVTLNYQFTYSSSSSFTEYSEKEVTEKFDVPAHTASVLFTKHVWIKASRLDSPVVLHQMELVANDDYYFSGCDL